MSESTLYLGLLFIGRWIGCVCVLLIPQRHSVEGIWEASWVSVFLSSQTNVPTWQVSPPLQSANDLASLTEDAKPSVPRLQGIGATYTICCLSSLTCTSTDRAAVAQNRSWTQTGRWKWSKLVTGGSQVCSECDLNPQRAWENLCGMDGNHCHLPQQWLLW